MSRQRYRSQRLRSGRSESSGGLRGVVAGIMKAMRAGKEGGEAMTVLTEAYQGGRTLDEILSLASSSTSTQVDDKAAESIRDLLGQTRNTLFNLHAITLGLADTLATLHDSVADLEERPLKDVVEGDA